MYEKNGQNNIINVEIFMIGMGSGQGCDAQYLFSEDILGYNKGHIPRHAKVYEDISEDFERMKNKSVKAYKKFKSEINGGVYPEKKHETSLLFSTIYLISYFPERTLVLAASLLFYFFHQSRKLARSNHCKIKNFLGLIF